MANWLGTILYAIYSAVLPHFVSLEAELRPEPNPESISTKIDAAIGRFFDAHPTLARICANIWIGYCFPVVRPVSWWRHMSAVNELLDAVGWLDRQT